MVRKMSVSSKVLVIGSAVADVIITLPHLPRRSEDVHVKTQEMRLGGCAFNTFDMIRHFGVEAIPFFPVGTGAYGDFIRKCFEERNIHTPIPTPQADNGCCYCFIEEDGERTFLSYHGAEYRFESEWFSLLASEDIDAVYFCGLEIEEPTGKNIVSFLEGQLRAKPDMTLYFAPGPRLQRIQPELMERIFALHPILHLNDEEACAYTQLSAIEDASSALYKKTAAPVIITLGQHGCCYRDDGHFETIPAVKTNQLDTIGAGDSHIGAIIACRRKGMTFSDAIRTANRISAKVVSISGALLNDREFSEALGC